MDAGKGRGQKYVSRFCSLLDDLVEAFRAEPGNQRLHGRLATRALFLACKLGLIPEPDWRGTELFGAEGWHCFDLSSGAHDQRWMQQQLNLRADREERIRRFQAMARSLVEKDLTLPVAPAPDRTNLAEDVRKFCEYLETVMEIYEMPDENPEIHRYGKKANTLALKIGVTCQDRTLALACGIARSEDKIPYLKKRWWPPTRAFPELDRRPIDRWRAWQKRAKALRDRSGTYPVVSSARTETLPSDQRQNVTASATEFDFFISHASEDKDDFVRPLAEKLRRLGAKVWYDEFTLRVGDSLRGSIDLGLSRSRYGIVVLSNSFFEKDWPQHELNGLMSRETAGRKVILPIWHGVRQEQVRQYSPILADKVALVSASKNLDEIAATLVEQLHPPR
jgi:hypothetical protein